MVDIARRVVPLCAASCADWRQLKRRLEKDPLAPMTGECKPVLRRPCGLGAGCLLREDHPRGLPRKTFGASSGSCRASIGSSSTSWPPRWPDAAEELDFERAARVKARIDTVNALADKQHAVSARNLNADVVGFFREETVAGVHVLMIREGRIINSNEFVLNRGTDVPDQDLLRAFLLRYYDATTSIPHEVVVRRRCPRTPRPWRRG